MINKLLVVTMTVGVLSLLSLLATTPDSPWSPPPASAAGCAVPSSVGGSQPSNGLITAAFNAAGFNNLFPGHQYFGLTALETGPADARSLQQPHVPPTLLKAIGWIEASWRQAEGGAPLISFDCGYGIMQITAPGVFPLAGIGMVQSSTDPDVYNDAQVPIATSYTHNIAFGVKTLIGKWNLAPEWRPLVGNGEAAILEDWYYALWSYNGFVSGNHPSSAEPLRGEYSCNVSDGFNHNRSQFPYQELVLGCVRHPPVVDGVDLWPPIPVTLPASVPPFDGFGEGMNMPTPQPAHTDPTSGSLPTPITIEAPQSGEVGLPFDITGWSVDYAAPSDTGIDAIHIYAYPSDVFGTATGQPVFLGAAAYGSLRSDVATFFGNPGFVESGFGLAARVLTPGFHTIVVYSRSTLTGSWFAETRVIRVVAPPMSLDTPAGGSTVQQPFLVAGWAIDQAAASGTGVDAVHVYAYPADASGAPTGAAPVFLGAAPYGAPRPDVGAVHGEQFTNSGYGLDVSSLAGGSYRLVVYARSTVTGAWNAMDRTIRVPSPTMALDLPSETTVQQTFQVSGWAIDQGAVSGSGVDAVHVYAYPSDSSGTPTGAAPVFLGGASYGAPRPDVAAVFGEQFTNSGYVLDATGLDGGFYRLVVMARSAATGMWNNALQVIQVSP
ncbi:MAG: hypothetical protein IIA91_04860 [Chloroflexi bacterium]|nr:hypothetical protein [Chloroflexota bacterium]